MNARLTVILPLKFFEPAFLNQAIDSIIKQSDPAWRLHVVVEQEDRAFFAKYLEDYLDDQRVELVVNRHRGFAGSFNSSMQQTDTEFCAILLGDDLWTENAVDVLNKHIDQYPHIDFFHSSRRLIDADNKAISSVYRSRENFSLSEFKWGSPVKHLLCWRRSKALAVGGVDEQVLLGPDDYDFPWVMAENGASFMPIDDCLYLYRNHGSGERLTTHTPLSLALKSNRFILKKHGIGWLEREYILFRKRFFGSIGNQRLYRNRLDRWLHKKGIPLTRKRWCQQVYK